MSEQDVDSDCFGIISTAMKDMDGNGISELIALIYEKGTSE